MLLFNLIHKEVTLTFTSDLMNFCMDQHYNITCNLHLVVVIFLIPCKSK